MGPIRRLLLVPLLAACASGPAWQVSDDGGRIETATLALACRPDGTLLAEAPGFTPVASNEEFSLGTDEDAWLLVADVVGATGPGVRATGAIPPDFLASLEATGTLAALYGPETVGPLAVPVPVRTAFVTRCRTILAA
jgi:hypothetical protein